MKTFLLQKEAESKDVIHSLKVTCMLSQPKNLNKNRFIIRLGED